MSSSVVAWLALGGGHIAIGHRPGKRRRKVLEEDGCTLVVNLLSHKESQASAGPAHIRLPLASADPPGAWRNAEVRMCFERMDEALAAGGRIYVHCSAGLHRTGMIANGFLRYRGKSADEARAGLDAMRPLAAEEVKDHRLAWGAQFAARPDLEGLVQLWDDWYVPGQQNIDLSFVNADRLAVPKVRVTAEALTKFPDLQRVTTTYSPFNDAELLALSTVPSIEHLELQGTLITDAGIAHLTALPKLAYLRLKETGLTDACVSHLAQIETLTDLALQGTYVTGKALLKLANLKNLQMLVLGEGPHEFTVEEVSPLAALLPDTMITVKGRFYF